MKKDLKIKTSWDLTPLFKSDDDPAIEKEKKRIEKESYSFIHKWKDRDGYLNDPKVLKEALDDYESWQRNCGHDGKWGFYFGLRYRQDQNNPQIKAYLQKVTEFSTKVENDIQFFKLKLGKITPEKQKEFLTAPALFEYKHYLEKIFKIAKYDLSDLEEKIVNLKSPAAYADWVKMTAGFVAKEEREVLLENGMNGRVGFSELSSLIHSQNKAVRDKAAEAINDILAKFVEVAEVEINAIVNDKKVNDELRKKSRPDLGRHLADDIESEVVDSLVESVSNRYDISSRVYKLKANLLGVSKLAYHERNVPYGKIDKKYTFEEATALVGQVFSRLDLKFGQIFAKFLENGQVDVYPHKGKYNGAFCWVDLITLPTYILLNHNDKLRDVLTIAHEFGHAINDELMREKQNALNFGTSLATAEVASTFMEDFVLQELLKVANEEQRLSLMVMKLDEDVSTIFRQVACYLFEKDLHKTIRDKGYLSKEEIGALFSKNMSEYMGNSVEQSPGSENWWVNWTHIRRFFYVYSYASGLLISKSLQALVKKDPKFILKVKEFLAAGMSDSPKNIFSKLGIDISDRRFWEKGIGEIENLLNETESLAKKLGKI